MSTTRIALHFPPDWIYGKYDIELFDKIEAQINQHFPDQNNVLLSLTWRPPLDQDTVLNDFIKSNPKIDNLFISATVDWVFPHLCYPVIERFQQELGVKNIYKLGNFNKNYKDREVSPHYFNFFAVVCRDHFEKYSIEDIKLTDPKYVFLSYNRKPYPHRRRFVEKLIEHNLKDHGVVTLGRPGNVAPGPDWNFYFHLNEDVRDYVKYGHWYDVPAYISDNAPESWGDHGGIHGKIPHDLFSLGKLEYWKHHFLTIMGGTIEHNEWDIFVHQIDFKPLIGLRPWLINGQTKNYQFLRDQGFRTFTHYFERADDLEKYDGQDPDGQLHDALIQTIKDLAKKTPEQLLDLYNQMLPDLLHNRQRWYEWADEQKYKSEHLFE